ncbi:MAG: asparagine synthase (glutamine-hydrolyzing) [Oceanospirillum sp.]|nr:asparagine synthase (glutamine-hydrolyzing) [Oceanospirillum sp.]
MCGFVFYHSLQSPFSQQGFIKALASLQHRGPDGDGHWFSEKPYVALGHTRLAINGGDSGLQPMLSSDERFVMAVNGELYNSCDALECAGITFQTGSDSEYLLQQFIRQGVECFDELDGEFAFAIWDQQTQAAYLGRDRHGIKPLFYAEHNGALIAASEIKALLAYGVPAKWNPSYLAGAAFFTQDASTTPVEGVFSLPPGHYLKVAAHGVECLSYVQQSPFEPALFSRSELSFEQACDQFEAYLLNAIEKRLPKTGSVQSYLSSGIDSSVITAIAAHLGREVNAYTIAFEEHQAFDEYPQAKLLVDALGVQHYRVPVSDQVLADHFASAVWHSEMPVPNINIAGKYYLSRVLAESGHKTVLTGEGADESLVGYGFFRQDLTDPYQELSQLPVPWFNHLQAVQEKFGLLPAQAVHACPVGLMLGQLRSEAYQSTSAIDAFPNFLIHKQDTRLSIAQKLHYHSVYQSYNLGGLADRTEMAHGIEGRPPFLDNGLVEFVHSLPTEYKLADGIDKRILRTVSEKFMPAGYTRIEKKPFIAAPASLRSSGPLAELFQGYFSDLSHLPEFYDKEKVRGFYQQALMQDVSAQARLDPVFMHLASLMVLGERFGMNAY